MSLPLSLNFYLTQQVARLGRRARLGLLCLALIVFGGMGMAPADAQGTRQNANATLSMALIRLNQNPRDAEALIAAGNAALAMGDTDAAVGFFTRATRLLPDNPRIEAGLAGAKVRAEDPFSAIPLFIAAEKGGPLTPDQLGDRGLAYDLIGDNANAQQYYRQALAARGDANADAEISRRLALSLAIGGDRRGSETVLSALLQKQDRAAWRTRIFALAILGYEEEAVATAKSTMPPEMALQIAPYLRYMRRLTPAQQAAAANLGHFPQAAEIGQDDPRVAQYARTLDRSRLASADAAVDRSLVPAGAPLGTAADKSSGKRRKDKHPATDRATPGNPAPPELVASRETQAASPSLLANPGLPPGTSLSAGQNQQANAPPPPIALEPAILPDRLPLRRPLMGPPQPGDFVSVPAVGTPVVQPLPRSAAAGVLPTTPTAPLPPSASPSAPRPHVSEPAARPSFSEAFSAMSPVVVDITPERGAVDLRRISPARAIPRPPPPPSHPSRIWVQLGVGRDTDRIAFDWRRMVKDDPEIFRGKKPFVSEWARTNRLLVGPFETDKAANAFSDRLHKADRASAFVWTSPAGQVVDPLDGQ